MIIKNYKGKIMDIKFLMFGLMMFIVTNTYAVGYSIDATINYIGLGKRYTLTDACGKTCVPLAVNPIPTGAPACARHSSGWHFAIDTSNDAGKQAYAAILVAQATGRLFTIEGTGTCFGNGFEEVNYIILK